MRRTTFFKFSPGGNTTLLLVDKNFSPQERAAIAAEVLAPLHLHAEQAGFVDLTIPRLEMAGGEFCLNATRTLGALLALADWEARPAPERPTAVSWRGAAQVSGMPAPVLLEISGDAARLPEVDAAVFLDLPSSVSCETVAPGATLVRLPGIVHLLLDKVRHPFPDDWRAASSRLPAPLSMENRGAPPIPNRLAKAPRIIMMGKQMPRPVKARSPTSGILPMYIRSTILYSRLTS